MNIYIYSDESGVFDRVHNRFFVFGGLVCISSSEQENWTRLYLNAENTVRRSQCIPPSEEVKASTVSNHAKSKLYRSLNHAEKFAAVIDQSLVHEMVYANPKSKQRYLDWAYKMAVKAKLLSLMRKGKIDPQEPSILHFFVDEHTTATDGIYELRESLEQEFRFGVFSHDFSSYYPPIFGNLKSVDLKFCNSRNKTLVRAADIVANHVYHEAVSSSGNVSSSETLLVKRLHVL